MSEDEIIYILKQRIERKTVSSDPYYITQKAIEGILDLYNKEKEKNKELENADLTTVYMSGFYDDEKKWKDKIRDKIEFYKNYGKINNTDVYVMDTEIEVLEELLEDNNV